jgi:capsid protein
MSMQTQIQSLVIRLSSEFKAIHAKIGNLGSLTTTDKSNLTAAINELKHAIVTASSIDDAQLATTTTWSSVEIAARLDALKTAILGGADGAYDTLLEIQHALANDTSGLPALLEAVNARVRFDSAQTLTSTQQDQACANIGAARAIDLGDPATDFVAVFEAALAK